MNLENYWAKSDGTSLEEHIDKLLDNLKTLKELFGDVISEKLDNKVREFWEALELTCKYHDCGKRCKSFQKRVGNPIFEKVNITYEEVRHNLLSPAFLPDDLDEPLKTLVALAIVHHHEYQPESEFVDRVKVILEEEFKLPLKDFHRKVLRKKEKEILKGREDYKEFYRLLKGFLLRIDHASSGKLADKVETKRLKETKDYIEEYLKSKGKLNDLQTFVLENRKDNLLILASTGYGKTEAGFLFLKNKGFFTIPIRTSANAIYERARDVFGDEHVGLLHSTALLHIIKDERNFDNDLAFLDYFITKNFAKPLTISTPDQLFPFVLRHKGFEKYYSLFSYSRIVLDELQLFNPITLGFIVKAIQKTRDIGEKICIMTATFPEYMRKDLEYMYFKEGRFFFEKTRHHIKILRTPINSEEGIEFIKRLSKEGKVLVILNTVRRAKELKEKIPRARLLHSRYIWKDRRQKEREIKEFFDLGETGVWVTTQIAEVSLDLDADFLITELAPIDSLIQRMGRVNRKGRKSIEKPNVYLFTENPSGIDRVYRRSLCEITKENLREGYLSEDEKFKLVETVYSMVETRDPQYIKDYMKAKEYIESLWELEEESLISKREVQEMFRDMDSVVIIPEAFRQEVEPLIRRYKEEKDKAEKYKLFAQILDYTLSLERQDLKHISIEPIKDLIDIYWAKGVYSQDMGF